jgi:enoyl-CoA hydratase/carnithine racemase
MSDFETIIYEKMDGKGYITLNRPKALNVYNIKMRDELYQALRYGWVFLRPSEIGLFAPVQT